LSRSASDPYTADKSHPDQCSVIGNPNAALQTLQVIMFLEMRACSSFVTERLARRNLKFWVYGALQSA
jgi:hypothetical protein